MNYNEAIEILELQCDSNEILKYETVKKQYHKLALLYHPDKNENTSSSNEKFRRVNEAYTYLKANLYESESCASNGEVNNEDINFTKLLHIFVNSMFDYKNVNMFSKIINDIYLNYEDLSLQLFDGLEQDVCLSVYNFIIKYRYSLHISQDKIDKIREILLKKFDNVLFYCITPKIDDLFNNMVYKLSVNDEIYIVPLWHNELYFENEMIVLCKPKLPPNVAIDINNNIILKHSMNIRDICEIVIRGETKMEICLGSKNITIPLSQVYMKREQDIILKQEGISKIKEDIYDVSDKSDIIVNLVFF